VGAVAAEHVGPWTVEEVLALPPDGQRHELVDGSLLVTPAPSAAHQRATSHLWLALSTAASGDVEVLEGINVRLGATRMFIPDVVVTSCPGAQFSVLDAASVLLVAEVVSPSTVAVDRMLKPQLYAAAGIPHYLRVELDGAGGPSVAAFDLTGGEYRPVAEARAGELLRLEAPVPVTLDPATLRGRQR
jgi:Uma2 family endonuclease